MVGQLRNQTFYRMMKRSCLCPVKPVNGQKKSSHSLYSIEVRSLAGTSSQYLGNDKFRNPLDKPGPMGL